MCSLELRMLIGYICDVNPSGVLGTGPRIYCVHWLLILLAARASTKLGMQRNVDDRDLTAAFDLEEMYRESKAVVAVGVYYRFSENL